MAFFNELGKKITQTSQDVMQKTKEMADIAKLNSAISDEERKIENLYTQIGQLYVSLHNQDEEPDFAQLLSELQTANEKIESIKQDIQDIKGIIRCAFCGAEMQKNATFCSSCGNAIVEQKKVYDSDMNQCSNCGNMIEKDVKFCTYCGTPVIKENIEQKNICVSCGAVLNDGVLFCTQCGTSVKKKDDDFIIEEPVLIKEEQQEKICTNCGMKMEDNVLFCVGCGTKVE